MTAADARRYSPAVARNREPLLAVLRQLIAAEARILEVASGSGEHALFFSESMPGWRWQATDPDSACLASIAAWRNDGDQSRLAMPLKLDVGMQPWPVSGEFDTVLCCNMIHIAPWQATIDLMRGAASVLAEKGQLILYGPFFIAGEEPAPGNTAFDADLRARNPAWGIRLLTDVAMQAKRHGFGAPRIERMPANNLTVAFCLDNGAK